MTERGDRGWKRGWRQGDFMDNPNIMILYPGKNHGKLHHQKMSQVWHMYHRERKMNISLSVLLEDETMARNVVIKCTSFLCNITFLIMKKYWSKLSSTCWTKIYNQVLQINSSITLLSTWSWHISELFPLAWTCKLRYWTPSHLKEI